MQPFNLDRQFIKWFYEEPYPNDLQNRAGVMRNIPSLNVEQRDYWMRQAFAAGARSMAGETLCILSDWATACEGLDPELVTPSETFDRAEENLTDYYTRLGLFQ